MEHLGGSRMLVLVSAAVLLSLSAVSCGGDDSTVDVTLQEFAIGLSDSSASAGEMTFDISNEGPDDVHEFVIVRTDLGPTELPTDDTGAVVETGEGIEAVDEVEDLAVGDSASLTVDLAAGSYVLICNIYDEDEDEAHYQEGMRTPFTVE